MFNGDEAKREIVARGRRDLYWETRTVLGVSDGAGEVSLCRHSALDPSSVIESYLRPLRSIMDLQARRYMHNCFTGRCS